MPSAFNDRVAPEPSQRSPLGSATAPAAKRVNLSQMFTLIDGILPFEACLYYQVLPLSIEGSRLNLGMVNLEDRSAADYVRRMLSYINCSIVSCEIPSDWHRQILSQYLNHTATAKQQTQLTEKTTGGSPNPSGINNSFQQGKHYPASIEGKKAPQSSVNENAAQANQAANDGAVEQKAPVKDELHQQNIRSTLIVDTPEQLDGAEENVSQQNRSTVPIDTTSAAPNVKSTHQRGASSPQEPNQPPLHLQVDSHESFGSIDGSIDELAKRTPKEIMYGLLRRVIADGIGRLYFEQLADGGRILWSKDGVLQSVLENLKPSIFQAVINELKVLTHLSLTAMHKPKQVEIERLYQGQRVLLRFRIMPGKHGEEATLQVLRGAALKFYQQQQIDKLSHSALGIAQKLQHNINQIRERGRQNLELSVTQEETLPTIIKLLKQMETQVQEIMLEQSKQSQSKDSGS